MCHTQLEITDDKYRTLVLRYFESLNLIVYFFLFKISITFKTHKNMSVQFILIK